MSILSNLKLSSEKKSTNNDPVIYRRKRLMEALEEQAQLAAALINDEPANIMRTVYETDEADGIRKAVQRPKRVRQWFWHNIEGTWFIEVRYANKALMLGKNQPTIEVGTKDNLLQTITTLIEAVKNGELDKEIENAGQRRKK